MQNKKSSYLANEGVTHEVISYFTWGKNHPFTKRTNKQIKKPIQPNKSRSNNNKDTNNGNNNTNNNDNNHNNNNNNNNNKIIKLELKTKLENWQHAPLKKKKINGSLLETKATPLFSFKIFF